MIFELLFLASGFNIITLAIVLLFKKRIPIPKANKLFSLMLFFMTLYCVLDLVHFFVIEHRLLKILRYYIPLEGIVLTLITPTFYLFVKAILQQPIKYKLWKFILFVLPTLLLTVYSLHIIFIPAHKRVEELILYYKAISIDSILINSLFYIQIIVILLICLFLLKKHYNTAQYIYYDKTPYNIGWLRTYIYLNLLYIAVSIPFYFYFKTQFARIVISQIGIELPIIYFFIRWTLNIDGALFRHKPNKANRIANMDVATQQLCVISEYMGSKKPYLSDKCTIQTVSEYTGITTHQISTVLNCLLEKSFTDYINELRVVEAKNMLLSSKSELKTIEAISIDCGFGSKSNFNKMFKKFTSQTPREYLRINK